MALIVPCRDFTPQFGHDCFLAENATIIGDVKASQWLLERRAPAEYSTKSTVDVVSHSQEPAIPATITTAQLEAELEEYDQ